MCKTLGRVNIENLELSSSESCMQKCVDTDSKIQSLRSAEYMLPKNNNAKNSRGGNFVLDMIHESIKSSRKIGKENVADFIKWRVEIISLLTTCL